MQIFEKSRHSVLLEQKILERLQKDYQDIFIVAQAMLRGIGTGSIPVDYRGSIRKALKPRTGQVLEELSKDPAFAERLEAINSEVILEYAEKEERWRKKMLLRWGLVGVDEYFKSVEFARKNVRGYEAEHMKQIESTYFGK